MAQAVAPRGDEMPEDVVADVMPEGVVHFLEMIDVEEHEGAVRGPRRTHGETA